MPRSQCSHTYINRRMYTEAINTLIAPDQHQISTKLQWFLYQSPRPKLSTMHPRTPDSAMHTDSHNVLADTCLP
jgi:hypothetical protein